MSTKKILILFFLCLTGTLLYAQANGLKIGDDAPLFKAKSYNGDTVDLSMLLKKGPVVLFFYRGSWCPYCNKQMSELQDSIQMITTKGATALAVSPETNESMKKMAEKSIQMKQITFVSDSNYKIMDAYKVSFKVDNETVQKYILWGLDIEKANGNKDDILPVPATYVIGKEGVIKYVFFNTDYKKRVSIDEILKQL